MTDEAESAPVPGVPLNVWIAFLVQIVIFAVVLFGAAGTVRWGAGWALIALFTAIGVPMTISLGVSDPALLQERMRIGAQPDQPEWDRRIIKLLLAAFALWLIVPGLDAVRFGWSSMPFGLQVLGGAVMAASLFAAQRVMLQNSYLAPTVRLQQERGHKVISTGAYAIVRHPFYAVLIPFFPAVGLLLGSWLCVAAGLLIIAILAYRATREERHLAETLEGYADYMARVRYRLAPGVW